MPEPDNTTAVHSLPSKYRRALRVRAALRDAVRAVDPERVEALEEELANLIRELGHEDEAE